MQRSGMMHLSIKIDIITTMVNAADQLWLLLASITFAQCQKQLHKSGTMSREAGEMTLFLFVAAWRKVVIISVLYFHV